MTIALHPSLSHIADRYDGFIIDLWGVIHDGYMLYPGVLDCLKAMRDRGKKIVFLSNAPRRQQLAVDGLDRLGVDRTLYDHVMTSGEATFSWLETYPYQRGGNYMIIGPELEVKLLDGLEYQRTIDPAAAHFIVVTGFEKDASEKEEQLALLAESIKHNIPMICANPDHVVVRQNGLRCWCAGIIAEQYAALGGKIIYFGKPYPEVYERCFALLTELGVTDKQRIAGIGDNLTTDVQGANCAGIDSILIAAGILGEKLGINHGMLPEIRPLTHLCSKYDTFPTGVLPAFMW